MSTAITTGGSLTDAPIVAHARTVPPPVQHHKFTKAEYKEMHRTGILGEGDRVELIFGEIVKKTVVGDPHIGCINRLNRFFVRAVGEMAVVSVQNALSFSDSYPEPDLAILKPSPDDYGSRKAGPADALLIIEVADSSLAFDRNVKGPLYASEGVPEYWIVNLIDRCLEVGRRPQPDGVYGERRILRPGETADIALLPGIALPVDGMF